MKKDLFIEVDLSQYSKYDIMDLKSIVPLFYNPCKMGYVPLDSRYEYQCDNVYISKRNILKIDAMYSVNLKKYVKVAQVNGYWIFIKENVKWKN